MFERGQKVYVLAYVESVKGDEIVVEVAGKKVRGTPIQGTAPIAAADTGDGGQETTPIVDFQETTPIVD